MNKRAHTVVGGCAFVDGRLAGRVFRWEVTLWKVTPNVSHRRPHVCYVLKPSSRVQLEVRGFLMAFFGFQYNTIQYKHGFSCFAKSSTT